MINWLAAAPAITSSFLASLVEVVEAFTIVLAVATVRSWRPALIGTAASLAVLAVLVLVFGPLLELVPIHVLQLVIGILLLLFGLRWLRKAILRSAGLLALHDETKAFANETSSLRGETGSSDHLDWIAGLAAFKAVMLEGVEVVFIVLAVGAGQGMLLPAAIGAAAAVLLVLVVGVLIHRPLAQVPENLLKFIVGVLLSGFGVFWTGEGLGVAWPGADFAIPVFMLIFLLVALASAAALRNRTAPAT